jgi:hypothetical protein
MRASCRTTPRRRRAPARRRRPRPAGRARGRGAGTWWRAARGCGGRGAAGRRRRGLRVGVSGGGGPGAPVRVTFALRGSTTAACARGRLAGRRGALHACRVGSDSPTTSQPAAAGAPGGRGRHARWARPLQREHPSGSNWGSARRTCPCGAGVAAGREVDPGLAGGVCTGGKRGKMGENSDPRMKRGAARPAGRSSGALTCAGARRRPRRGERHRGRRRDNSQPGAAGATPVPPTSQMGFQVKLCPRGGGGPALGDVHAARRHLSRAPRSAHCRRAAAGPGTARRGPVGGGRRLRWRRGPWHAPRLRPCCCWAPAPRARGRAVS